VKQQDPQPLASTEQFWKNVEIVDATQCMIIHPQKHDVDIATPGDPEHCIYAECIRRVDPNARRIRIWRTVALVETKGKRGQPLVLRYVISSKGQKALKDFDRGMGKPAPCMLLPPTESTNLERKRRRNERRAVQNKEAKKRLQIQRREEMQAGTYKPTYTRKPQQIEMGIRNGSGHAQRAGS
jgi:hypothetical protein